MALSSNVVTPGTHAASTASSTALTMRPASRILSSSRWLLRMMPMFELYACARSASSAEAPRAPPGAARSLIALLHVGVAVQLERHPHPHGRAPTRPGALHRQ